MFAGRSVIADARPDEILARGALGAVRCFRCFVHSGKIGSPPHGAHRAD
jgi:hypothetical protein